MCIDAWTSVFGLDGPARHRSPTSAREAVFRGKHRITAYRLARIDRAAMTLERRAGIFGRRFDPAPNGAQSFRLIISRKGLPPLRPVLSDGHGYALLAVIAADVDHHVAGRRAWGDQNVDLKDAGNEPGGGAIILHHGRHIVDARRHR